MAKQVGTLVSRTIQCLIESRDASTDCQTLIASLRSLEASIAAARATLDVGYGSQASANAIRHELDACEGLIQDFYARSKDYTETLCGGTNKSRVIQELRKISWTLFGTGDIQRLHRDLQGHLQALDLLMSTLSYNLLQQLHDAKHESTPTDPEESIDSGHGSPAVSPENQQSPVRFDMRPSPSPEVLMMQAQLDTFRMEKKREAEAQERSDFEAMIRRETEENIRQRMDDLKKAQEEAKAEVEQAKREAVIKAREALEAEQKAREEERRKREEEMARVERAAREKFEAELMARKEARRAERGVIRRTWDGLLTKGRSNEALHGSRATRSSREA
ncbi:uncharacterized protein DNG_07279 [Cephalotrichum gorgonifer]|uniref:Uncharacterized protein n=1 Tax=Cephalotrichum gorgonifer TaxID=2041049 RepID=A0AAE8N319_9PEZI|nr:uncharacterized protein DNG_07279 [Cephalotrichum gorgonifer]